MSDEKKYTVDDILAEYDSKKALHSEKAEPVLTEEAEVPETESVSEKAEPLPTEKAEVPETESVSVKAEPLPIEVAEAPETESTSVGTEPVPTEKAEVPETESISAEDPGAVKTDDEDAAAVPESSKMEAPLNGMENSETTDNYEDGEEQDISGKGSAEDPMYAPAELFDSDRFKEEQNKAEDDDEDFETSEELFADEDDENDDIEITEELLEEEPQESEDTAEADAALTWAENGITDEITDIDIPEEREYNDRNGEAETEKTGEASGNDTVSDAPSEAEDVNDKWIVRFAKGIFPVKGDSVGEVIRKMIFLIALIVFIGAGIMLASTLIQSAAARRQQQINESIIETTLATYIDENGNVIEIAPTEEEIAQHNFDVAAYYKKINPDYVGYLEVEGCSIYEPVVQSGDNDKYLRTDIAGGYNKAGTIFMDYRCIVTEDHTSPNIVLYGHNQEDTTMFGKLKWYKQDAEFYSEHPTVKFSTEYGTSEYLIYGFFVTNVYAKQSSTGEVFHYHDYIETMNDEYTFNWYIKQVQRRNQIVSPVDVEFGDELLCLSTCSNEFSDSRFVVFARKLREGESVSDYDFSQTYLNPNAEGIDWDAIMSGETTPAPEIQDVIEEEEEEEDEAPEVAAINKSNGKTNSGRGSKTNEVTVAPPPDETTATETTAPETTTKKKTTTTTSETTEVSETEIPAEEASGSETSQEEGSETEAPSGEESEQTETAAG